MENRDLYGIANYNCDLVTSKVNGVSYELERKTHWVETQNWGNDVMLVNWTNSINAEDWKGTTMTDLARQFEKAYPGWNVIAGINGDFFKNSKDQNNPLDQATFEPTGFYIQHGGDVFRPCHAGGSVRQTIGWKYDGSVIVGNPTIEENMTLHIGDLEIPVTALEKAPTDNGVGIITVRSANTFDLTGYTVYKVKNIAFRVAHANSKYFIRGEVVGKEDALTEVKGTTG